MSCEFNAGRDMVLQLGLGSVWGTKVDATKRLPVTSEGIAYTPNYTEAETFIGSALGSRVEILSEHVEGDIATYLTPDEIALILYATLGVEYVAIEGPVAGTYKHYFVPLKSGGDKCLPMLSAEVDRAKEVMTYDSLKINSLGISAGSEGYVDFSISLIGRDEADGGALTGGINLSSKEYFKFRGAKVYADTGSGSAEMTEVTNIDFSYENNLSTARYTSDQEGKLAEINPQGRAASLSLTVFLSDSINTMRKNIFKTGATMGVELTFEVADVITGTTKYQFAILLPNCYLTEVPYNIDSPDEISFDLSFMVKDHDDVDFVGNGTGKNGQTITVESGDTFTSGSLVKVTDADGFSRVFKYLGSDMTATGTTVTFADSPIGTDDLPSIFSATDELDDTNWEIAEGVTAYVIDGNSGELV
jgi:hypothetical protein